MTTYNDIQDLVGFPTVPNDRETKVRQLEAAKEQTHATENPTHVYCIAVRNETGNLQDVNRGHVKALTSAGLHRRWSFRMAETIRLMLLAGF